MDYDLYDNSEIFLNGDSPTYSDNLWNPVRSDNSMDGSDDYFTWTPLKIDEEKVGNSNGGLGEKTRKRKLSSAGNEAASKGKSRGYQPKDPLDLESSENVNGAKMADQIGTAKMPHWQVDDITELNEEIDNSLTAALTNNAYTVSDTLLSLSGLTVFKQEVPSPSHEVGPMLQISQPQRQSPTSTQNNQENDLDDSNSSQRMINNTLTQLLNQSAYVNISGLDTSLVASPSSQDSYNVTSTNSNYAEDARFQYVLAAATSIATKLNEDTLTYLNQGQSYEIKLKKLGDLSMYRGKMLKSIIRICFHERRLQYMEKEQMSLWQKARPGDRILEVDVPLSYGASEIIQPSNALNVIHFNWDPTKEVGVYIKVNCISTEFTPKKHGGEKGVPFRIQVETYSTSDNIDPSKRLHAAACQIKVFKLKGADRKHKQDREKIMKRPIAEQKKYQPSYECTVLNDIPSEAVLNSPPIVVIAPPESNRPQVQATPVLSNHRVVSKTSPVHVSVELSPNPTSPQSVNEAVRDVTVDKQRDQMLAEDSTPQQTEAWLIMNRFEKFVSTFANFSGADMLRLSREDLIQICGHADGIRLFNALHSKTLAPLLKIYVCREGSSVFNAIFLTSYNYMELLGKLALMVGLSKEQIFDIYIEGPQSIRVQMTNDVLRHIKEETMFSIEILQENGKCVFLLKSAK